MKSATRPNPDAPSCYETAQSHVGILRVRADDQRVYLLSVHHFVDGVLDANPDSSAQASTQRLTLRFTTCDVCLLGTGLERVEDRLSNGQLRAVQTIASRHPGRPHSGPYISSITVKLKEEA